MYLHAGGNVIVLKKNIIGIFDIDNMNTGEDTKNFLRAAEKRKITESAGENLPKSFILIREGKKEKIVFSQFSAQWLAARAEQNII